MDDLTTEIVAAMQQKTKRLQALLATQDVLTQDLRDLEKRYDLGQVTQAELDKQLALLTPRHQSQQQDIAVALVEVEQLRQNIFNKTGLALPPII